MKITDHFDLAHAAAMRDPLTVRDMAEAVDHLQNFQDALLEWADNPPPEPPLMVRVSGETFQRKFKSADDMAAFIASLLTQEAVC